jgi:hypothetical protein
MKKIPFILLGSTLLTLASTAGPMVQDASADGRCHRIDDDAGLQSTATTDGCTSPVGLCTAGTFKGDHLLRGTTSFVADGLAPAAGMPAVEAGTTLSYSGLLTITTHRGTLTTRDTGIFDTAAGLFASRDIVVGGTGIFAGATGHIFFHGTGTTSFDSAAAGEICLAH